MITLRLYQPLLTALFIPLLAASCISTRGPAQAVGARSFGNASYPREHWTTKTPQETGLDPRVLERLSQFMQGRGCIVRHGFLVYTWGDYTARGDIASAAKPFYSYFLFKAIENRLLPSVDTKVAKYIPELAQLNPALGYKDREITFRHLANQTSCYGVRETPGTAFDYNDWQMALFVEAQFLRVYGATYPTIDARVLRPMLTDALQCEDDPTLTAFGAEHHPGRVAISPRDFCRFGYLFLHEGRWNGAQLLSREHARRCVTDPLPATLRRTRAETADMRAGQDTLGSARVPDNQCDHDGSYSWLWWINGVNRDGKRRWPNAPVDTFAALGHHNGMRGMAVIPSLDIVVSWNDTVLGDMKDADSPLDTSFELLRAAVTD